MGFLRKIVKKVKKGVKKVVKGVKKVFKKITSSKALKAIALVGAAIVTGGAFVGAYGGALKASTVGNWLFQTSNAILATPVVGTLATPFKWLGATAGTGAGKVTDFLGFTSEAGRLGTAKYTPEQAKTMLENLTQDDLARMKEYQPELYQDLTKSAGTELVVEGGKQTSAGNFLSNIGTGLQFAKDAAEVYQDLQDPEVYGRGGSAGRETEFGLDMQPLQLAYAQPVVNIADAYSNLSYGTGDIGYLASDLYRQQTIGVAV